MITDFKPFFLILLPGDCPKPEGGHNTVLTNESLLKNVFPENIMVTLQCSSGYIKESGSEFITCINDQWTESELICKSKSCLLLLFCELMYSLKHL